MLHKGNLWWDYFDRWRKNVHCNVNPNCSDFSATNGNGNVHRNTEPKDMTCQQLQWANSEDIAKVKQLLAFDRILQNSNNGSFLLIGCETVPKKSAD
mmetsp:Transcript_51309/g.51724  ORF Transcript_51309/g.51724 Transcript_51309/m.51724 type:complete len:97 (+) Transcript_51309:213-503(+)